MEIIFSVTNYIIGYHIATKFAYDMIAQLSCHVQNFVAITWLQLGWEKNEFSIEFEFELRWKTYLWNGPHWGWPITMGLYGTATPQKFPIPWLKWQVKTDDQLGPKPLPESILTYYQSYYWEQISVNLKSKYKILPQNAFKNAATLFQPQCVNSLRLSDAYMHQ